MEMTKKSGDLMTAKAQVGIEYMMVVGFVTLAIVSVLTLAYFYSDQIKDSIRLNQVESFAMQILNSAESVFFAGEPSKTTVKFSKSLDKKPVIKPFSCKKTLENFPVTAPREKTIAVFAL